MTHTVADRFDRVRAIHHALTDTGPEPLRSVHLSDAAETLTLRPPTREPAMPLHAALDDRRSRYDYAPLDHEDLSALLRWALGPQRTLPTAGGGHRMSMHPSAGGLASTTAFPIVLRHIDGIAEGVYQFDRDAHQLLRRREGDVRGALTRCLVQPEFAERTPVIIVIVGELEATLVKYSERHYRTLHVDAGLAVANLYLVATALDLACCAISGFYDDQLAETLSLSESQIPLVAFAVGARRQVREQR
ncbi:SagB family peptide dehydrogenase [Williamsia soli]|uniref:SagB family peptide dehydrogenase n=1 Tax=Williamsia soli TaxID=364929 RepID=UPI001A9F5E6B|nr:SagB family peptide dehydrogenase [Williamsia soli]